MASIAIPLRRLAYWDVTAGRWVVEPGEYRFGIGRSSRDLPIKLTVTVIGNRLEYSSPEESACNLWPGTQSFTGQFAGGEQDA